MEVVGDLVWNIAGDLTIYHHGSAPVRLERAKDKQGGRDMGLRSRERGGTVA